MKKSALIIVCNGIPFIIPQLINIYNLVDEIIIVEGADNCYSKVIGSRRSTDKTVEAINDFDDCDNKIKLVQEEYNNKNEMVKLGTSLCTGDYIYQVDVDEFQPSETIELAFEMLKEAPSVRVPQRWYYKWCDVCLYTNRDEGIGAVPTRFWRNEKGLYPSHIPWTGYRKMSDDSWLPCQSSYLPFGKFGRHYLLLFEFQLVSKLKYYQLRDGVNPKECEQRLDEWKLITREDAEAGVCIKSYKNRKLFVESPTIDYKIESFL